MCKLTFIIIKKLNFICETIFFSFLVYVAPLLKSLFNSDSFWSVGFQWLKILSHTINFNTQGPLVSCHVEAHLRIIQYFCPLSFPSVKNVAVPMSINLGYTLGHILNVHSKNHCWSPLNTKMTKSSLYIWLSYCSWPRHHYYFNIWSSINNLDDPLIWISFAWIIFAYEFRK